MALESTLAGLLATCKALPEDDTPRLVLADWLDDHGEEARAELVRLQCRLAGLPTGAPERAALWAREQELLTAHRQTWLGALAEVSDSWWFRRGLVGGNVAWGRLGPRQPYLFDAGDLAW